MDAATDVKKYVIVRQSQTINNSYILGSISMNEMACTVYLHQI